MKKYRFYTYLGLFLLANLPTYADVLEQFRNRAMSNLNEFRDDKQNELEGFRRGINEDIAKFMSSPWSHMKITPKLDPPTDPSPDPIHIDMDTVRRKVPKPIIIEEIIPTPNPTPRPQPIEPIIAVDPPKDEPVIDVTPVINKSYLEVMLYGTKFSIRQPDLSEYALKGNDPNSYANGWRSLNTNATNNLIIDCLAQREEKSLCDWAFLKFVQLVSDKLYPENKNKATLLSGFLLSQCGYRVRFATDDSNRLHLLYSPNGTVYQVPFFSIDGYTYYVATEFDKNAVNYSICNFKCPGEKQMSFEINQLPRLDFEPAETREIRVHNHPEMEICVTTNRNLLDFYDQYPVATIGENKYTQWAIYANTPVSPELKKDLYPMLKEAVKGMAQKEAANLLIHLAESFPYGYDSEIWGRDRAFFVEESWYYPFSDCEDHAIHFTRLVRDILGLEAVLVFYPGHLASAIAFTDPAIEGDYVIHKGKKFTICDPTIFYADVGTTMSGFNNDSAVIIDLSSW